MAAWVQALVHGVDYAHLDRNVVSELLGRELEVKVMIDSNNFFNVVAKDRKTTERRFQIDGLVLHQSYDMGELS